MSHDYNPYSPSGQQFPPHPGNMYGPPRGSSGTVWLWVIGGTLLVGGGLCVACCVGLFFFGTTVLESQLLYDLRDHPVIQEHIGEIQEVSVNIAGTGATDDDSEVYDLRGTKGSGELTAYFDDDHNFISGTLRLPSGETYEIE